MSCYYYFLNFFILDLSCGECNVISLYFLCCSVNESVCLVCCVLFWCCVCLQLCCRMLWRCIVWVEVLCWIDRVVSSKECVCCASDLSVHLDVPSIGFVNVCVRRM